jgi:hypothetical protein
VYVGEIIREGSEREFLQMKPAPYNIVLEDGTYRGELKLGLKFITNVKETKPANTPIIYGYTLPLQNCSRKDPSSYGPPLHAGELGEVRRALAMHGRASEAAVRRVQAVSEHHAAVHPMEEVLLLLHSLGQMDSERIICGTAAMLSSSSLKEIPSTLLAVPLRPCQVP